MELYGIFSWNKQESSKRAAGGRLLFCWEKYQIVVSQPVRLYRQWHSLRWMFSSVTYCHIDGSGGADFGLFLLPSGLPRLRFTGCSAWSMPLTRQVFLRSTPTEDLPCQRHRSGKRSGALKGNYKTHCRSQSSRPARGSHRIHRRICNTAWRARSPSACHKLCRQS